MLLQQQAFVGVENTLGMVTLDVPGTLQRFMITLCHLAVLNVC